MSHSPSPYRSLAAAIVVTGAVVVPSAAALATDTAPDAVANKAQVDYNERRADQDELVRGNKARIEHEERLAARQAQPASSSSSPDAGGLSTGIVVGALGLGIAAAAGGSVFVVRHQQARPRTT